MGVDQQSAGSGRSDRRRALDAGDLYHRTVNHGSVADAAQIPQTAVQNPSGSGVVVYLTWKAPSTGPADGTVGFDVTIDTQGTRPTPINENREAADDAALVIDYGGSYTVNGPSDDASTPGSVARASAAASSGENPGRGGARLGPGDSMLIDMTNRAGGSARYAYGFEWEEV